MAKPKSQQKPNGNASALGFDATFWAIADKLRGKGKGDIWRQFAKTLGQKSSPTTGRLERINLAIRRVEGILGREPAYTFHRELPDTDRSLARAA